MVGLHRVRAPARGADRRAHARRAAGRLRLVPAAAVHLLGHRVGRADAGPEVPHRRPTELVAARGHHRHRRPAAAEPARCWAPSADALGTSHGGGRASTSRCRRVTEQPRAPRDGDGRRRRSRGRRRRRRGRRADRRPARGARRAPAATSCRQLRLLLTGERGAARQGAGHPAGRPGHRRALRRDRSSSAPRSTSSRRPAGSPGRVAQPAAPPDAGGLRQHRGPRGLRADARPARRVPDGRRPRPAARAPRAATCPHATIHNCPAATAGHHHPSRGSHHAV